MISEKHRDQYTAENGASMVQHAARMIEFGGGDLKLDLTAPRPYLEAFHQGLGEYLAGEIHDDKHGSA